MTVAKKNTSGLASLALPTAIKANNLETIATLLGAGADPDIISNNVPAMAVAARNGFDKALSMLLAAGGDVHQTDGSGHSILRAAMESHEIVCVKKLLEAGADPCNVSYDFKSERDLTDWEYASKASRYEIAVPVLSAAAAFRLNAAVAGGKTEEAIGFLEKGVRPDTRDRFGKSALIHACETGNALLVERLLAAGAKPGFAAKNSATPLHSAVKTGRSDLVETLMQAGADGAARDETGISPLQLARKGGDQGLINIIEGHMRRQQLLEATTVTTLSQAAKPLKTVRFKPPGV